MSEMDWYSLIEMFLSAVKAKDRGVVVNHHYQLDWLRLTVGTHLWL